MSIDPDFHQAADAWLDTGEAEGQGRILLDILHDSPAAAREFAALARVRAVLENAPLSEQERLQRAAQLLRFSLRRKLRILTLKPAVRWSAAAALLLGSVTWMVTRPGPPTPPQVKLSHPPPQNFHPITAPGGARSPEPLPPADPAYVKLMDAVLIPDFEAVDLPLQEAIALLIGKTAAAESKDLTVTMGEPTAGHPEKRVHLKLKYQPASTLLKLIALQTGMKVRATGQSYHLSPETDSDSGGLVYQLVNLERWDAFLQSQGMRTSATATPNTLTGGIMGHESGRGLEPPPAAAGNGNTPDHFRLTLLGTLCERPESVEVLETDGKLTSSPSLRVGASQQLNAMLELLLAGDYAPGVLEYDMRWVTFKDRAAVERMFNCHRKPEETAGTEGPALWSEESLPRLLKFLAEDSGVKIISSTNLRIPPGGEFTNSMGRENPDTATKEINEVCDFSSEPSGGKTTISLHLKSEFTTANGRINTQELSNKLTLAVGSTYAVGGMIWEKGEHMMFVTPRLPGALPYGIMVEDQPGFVRSPFALDKGTVNVEGIPPGVKVKCPFTGQVFRVPG